MVNLPFSSRLNIHATVNTFGVAIGVALNIKILAILSMIGFITLIVFTMGSNTVIPYNFPESDL